MKLAGCDAEGRLTHVFDGGTELDLVESARLSGCAGYAFCDFYPSPDDPLDWIFFPLPEEEPDA